MRNKQVHERVNDASSILSDPDIVEVPIDDDLVGSGDVSPAHGVCAMGRDPLETIMLHELAAFHVLVEDSIRLVHFYGGSPQSAAPHLERAMVLSKRVEKLHEAVRKHRGRGEQKVIVEHKTVPASVERANRAPARQSGRAANVSARADRKLVTT